MGRTKGTLGPEPQPGEGAGTECKHGQKVGWYGAGSVGNAGLGVVKAVCGGGPTGQTGGEGNRWVNAQAELQEATGGARVWNVG